MFLSTFKNNGGDSNGLPYFTVLCISLGKKICSQFLWEIGYEGGKE
jgi:hypothetical protein